MKFLKSIGYYVMKFSKGMLALFTIYLIVLACTFFFDSCKKSEYDNSSVIAKTKFLSALGVNKETIGSISLAQKNKNHCTLKSSTMESQTFYMNFPIEIDDNTSTIINNTSSLDGINNVIHEYNATLQYIATNTNSDYQFEVLINDVVNSLNPLIEESKQYLNSKGFTDQDIQDMLIEEEGQETDLVPFVMALTQIESNLPIARNYSNLFINSAYANQVTYGDYIDCVLIAIGADVLFSLGSSAATAWSVAALKKAFGAVAKRALGPIGAAIAVVSFGICIYEKYE